MSQPLEISVTPTAAWIAAHRHCNHFDGQCNLGDPNAIPSHIYPEIRQPMRGLLKAPEFPAACPACGAEVQARGNFFHPVTYACGGSYDEKPQIQNHTDVWWGRCPRIQSEVN
jgi:hypothetical protein